MALDVRIRICHSTVMRLDAVPLDVIIIQVRSCTTCAASDYGRNWRGADIRHSRTGRMKPVVIAVLIARDGKFESLNANCCSFFVVGVAPRYLGMQTDIWRGKLWEDTDGVLVFWNIGAQLNRK
jgi:hypothetical protein